MAKNSVCSDCGQTLVKELCVNKQCVRNAESVFGSLVPGEFASMDPTQIIDFTGTIGVNPGDVDSAFAHDSVHADADSAQTRMVDDNFYKQIQSFFPADSGSGSAEIDKSASSNPDVSRSLSIRGVRDDYSVEEFVPPVRDIRFPSDTASLQDIKDADPASIEGDEYHIVEKLGEGGYGVVFEAEQMALNRPVAVKVLKPKRKKAGTKSNSRTGTGTGELQRRRDQFLHEAKITARLQHPNIVPLYDFGINAQGQLFYSMKKVERRPWSSVIHNQAKLLDVPEDELTERSERESINKNVEIFDRVCDAMAYSHAKKIIHRDLKPDNIMIGDYGEVLLIDFGMALDFGAGQPDFSAGGTLVYMAPEMAQHFAKQKEIQVAAQKTAQKLGVELGSVFLDQSNLMGIGKLAEELIQQSKDDGVISLAETLIRLDGEEKKLASKISYASDIYLLGAILYQIAVGHPPHYFPIAACKKGRKEKFQKELFLAVKNGFQQYGKLTDPLRISLRNIAVRAMRTDPENRFQTVEELQDAIKGFQLEVQSLEMTETGKEELDKAAGGTGYQHLLPALESFRGATALSAESGEAKSLQIKAACEYASRAHNQKDFDAGLSILDEYVAEEEKESQPVVQVRDKLVDGKRKRARNRKLAWVSSLAAVLIPIGTFFYFSARSADVISKLATAQKDIETANENVKKANLLAANATAEAQKEVVAAKEIADKEIAESKLTAEKTIKETTEQAEQDVARAKQEAEAQIAKEKMMSEQEIAKSKAMSAQEIAAAKEMSAAEIAAAKKIADEEIKLAVEQSKLAKAEAEKYAFEAEVGLFNANVLPIPLDLRLAKLDEARQRLAALQESSAKPYLKNGWMVSHFAKRANAGTMKKVAEKASVADIVPRPGSANSIVFGTENGKPAIWETTPDGKSKKLAAELPSYGDVADISISGDGKWLALAIDNVSTSGDKPQDHLWVVNLDDGTRAEIAKNESVVGCRIVEFAPDGLQLMTVEELSGYRGLKERVQVVTRSIEDGKITPGTATPVGATTRDEGRVRYLATASWDSGKPRAGLAYQSLDKEGADVFELESLTVGSEGSSPLAIKKFPTALHLDGDKFYCGHADGSVDQFLADNLAAKPTTLENRNESEVVRIASSGGKLITASESGAIVIWDQLADGKVSFNKKMAGHSGELSALAIGKMDPVSGISMISGDANGFVKYWAPETSRDDAVVRKNASVTVTSGAIDIGLASSKVPSTAYGTNKGQVYYFKSEDMLKRGGGTEFAGPTEGNATFRFRSPFESFGTAFNDFDSMGIVDDHFVLMKDDGTFYSSFIDKRDKKQSARTQVQNLSEGKSVTGNFNALLASVPDKDYFYTTSPQADDRLLLWKKNGASFSHQPVELKTSKGAVKRLKMSPDGNWLAVVRQVGRLRLAGQYVAEIYDVSSGSSDPRLANPTEVFQVGDPAFVGFSPNSDEMILHFHKQGIDRETWVEHWKLADQRWSEAGEKEKIDNRKVSLVDWDLSSGSEKLITKINKNFFLVNRNEPVSYTREKFNIETKSRREQLRTVRPTGDGDNYYVLSSSGLSLYAGTTKTKAAEFDFNIKDARDLRVFGDQAVLLDNNGFHLIDSNLNYVTKLADRQEEVKSLSLSTGRLAILYTNDLCRIWDVRGETPSDLGSVEGVQSVKLSPDGRWAVCQTAGGLQVLDVGSKFTEVKMKVPFAGGAFDWNGDNESNLIVGENAAGKVSWKKIDPASGALAPRAGLPTDIDGLVDFELAPITKKYMAIKSKSGFSLWAVGDELKRMSLEENDFDESELKNAVAFAFSEIRQDKLEDIGTRLVVTAKSSTAVAEDDASPEQRIFLLASEDAKVVDGVAKKAKYRPIEIEGAFDKIEGFQLLDSQFSGDGRSLLQVDDKGISTLLGQ
ncbi:MAG: protein kinase [Mariniblastus sp.]